jgi:hypothetical protein
MKRDRYLVKRDRYLVKQNPYYKVLSQKFYEITKNVWRINTLIFFSVDWQLSHVVNFGLGVKLISILLAFIVAVRCQQLKVNLKFRCIYGYETRYEHWLKLIKNKRAE